LVFFLTMEAFGRIHPHQRNYGQWEQMSECERDLHRRDIADLYVTTARKYEHAAIFVHAPGGWRPPFADEEIMRTLDHIRRISGTEFFLAMEGDATYSIPSGQEMTAFVEALVDRPQEIKDQAKERVEAALRRAEVFRRHGVLDGFICCSDYCFNSGPFLSPPMFSEFVTPYLQDLVRGYRAMGLYVIKHTDGNIMPILDDLLSARPHALHSLDPQGGVDIAEVKRRAGDQVCLIGNVSCAALDTGSDQEAVDSVRYALRHGMPGGGYIFSTSNCVYTGMPLRRYELMLDTWRREGNYPEPEVRHALA